MKTQFVVLNVTSKFSSNDCFKFEFKVEKFSNVRNVTSSNLITSHKYQTSWCVVLETTQESCLNSRNPFNAGGKMRVGLRRTDLNDCNVEASFFFQILNSSGHVYFKESIEKNFSESDSEFFCDYARRPGRIAQVTRIRRAEFALPDDKLTVKGFVAIHNCCPTLKSDVKTNHDINLKEQSCNFGEMYRNHCFADVVFCFGKSKLHAHKAILVSRSPVFKSMFEKDMMEKRLNEVQITDINKHVFDTFLMFLYTGVFECEDFNTALSLYQVADKYEVTSLFKTCSNILESYISAETVTVIFKFADMHNDQVLKQRALSYIINDFRNVEGTIDWNNLIDTDPVSASSILLSISLNTKKGYTRVAKDTKKN